MHKETQCVHHGGLIDAATGGINSPICAPVQTSHAKMAPADRDRLGITDTLLRLSVGIEHLDDLIADLTQALDGRNALNQP
ncbi:MAG: PLP-dependent transferase [Kiritimatiellia bacterium]